MTWMALAPVTDTSMAAHWVRPAAEYIPLGAIYRGIISGSGWVAACGVVVQPLPERVDNAARPTCPKCAAAAPDSFRADE